MKYIDRALLKYSCNGASTNPNPNCILFPAQSRWWSIECLRIKGEQERMDFRRARLDVPRPQHYHFNPNAKPLPRSWHLVTWYALACCIIWPPFVISGAIRCELPVLQHRLIPCRAVYRFPSSREKINLALPSRVPKVENCPNRLRKAFSHPSSSQTKVQLSPLDPSSLAILIASSMNAYITATTI